MRLTFISALLFALLAPAALAAPPANDNRANAQSVTPGNTVSGTVVDATREDNEASGACRGGDVSVWYQFTPPSSGDVVITLDAGGNLDASVNVYERGRSQLTPTDCADTDKKGSATLDLDNLRTDHAYLIQVVKRFGSDPGDFKLGVLVPSPPAAAPGKALPRKGVKDSVDRLLNPSDEYNRHFEQGVTYRVSLATDGCTSLEVQDHAEDAVANLRCGGYRLFTPEQSGRYFFVVGSGRRRGAQPYRLKVGRAHRDDTTPGVFIRNDAKVKGHVNGRLDSVDLYRFDVTRRSRLTLSAHGDPELTLLGDAGHRIDSGSDIERAVPPGRYYVAVRGAGAYTLRRISRVITHSSTRFNGALKTHAAPGQSVDLSLLVRPGVDGRGTIVVERLDPVAGWQFLRRYHVGVAAGRGAVTFLPPSVGHYRARASYEGTRTSSPSDTNDAKLTVSGPLVE